VIVEEVNYSYQLTEKTCSGFGLLLLLKAIGSKFTNDLKLLLWLLPKAWPVCLPATRILGKHYC
jgi:hypothetical protein